MLSILTCPRALSSAFRVLFGGYGDVTRHAHASGISRQAVYRESAHLIEQLQDHPTVAQQLQELKQQVATLSAQNRELQAQLARSVPPSKECFGRFAATGQAEGVSLPVLRRLLAVCFTKVPSVASLGRLSVQAARRAAALLPVIDAAARPQARVAALDEIFFGRRPTLMAIEPESMCWLSGRLVPHRDGPTWAEELRGYPSLAYAVTDAGNAVCKGVQVIQGERQTLRHGQDLFHTAVEGNHALRQMYRTAQTALQVADKQQIELQRRQQHGIPRAGQASATAKSWRRAERRLDEAAAADRAWQECRGALDWFTPDGRLNDRVQATATLERVLPRLQGHAWDKTKRLLRRPATLAFLDEAAQLVASLGLDPTSQEALVQLEWLRRHGDLLRGESTSAAAWRGVMWARTVQLTKAGLDVAAQLTRLRAALRRAWRSSSLVEGINSVARMQQARHRKMTQGLLDLKRLYWNMRQFRTGRRKGKTPYELLGLKLPQAN
jgi:hypothetical protein